MNTRNVNVTTAAPESSRKMGEDNSAERECIAGLIALYSRSLQTGFRIVSSDLSRCGDVQIEIFRYGLLAWRALSSEPDFMADLKRYLLRVQRP
ncbi:hypothetical protein ACI2I2_20110 [Scandinavium sp. NPDC088450]|uniref:hypothetical protein n=1 Tax=Scandinavium sp. NPDC088450 TaxID=3364514 RepID=UPI00384DA015